MHHAWKGYESKAWSANGIKPVLRQKVKGYVRAISSLCVPLSPLHP